MNPTAGTLEAALPVVVAGDTARVRLPAGEVTLPLVGLPAALLEWIDAGRRSVYRRLAADTAQVGFFSQHLPALVTYDPEALFPFNCGNKGVGFLPRAERLEEVVASYRDVLERTRGVPWRESLEARLEVASRFNFDRDAIDCRCLGSLEIFEKATLRNLRRWPLASLLYTGNCPDYMSFQLNCAVEVIGEEDPRHQFLKLSRTLFEYDGFHIAQRQFPHAYVFWVAEASEKTPYRVAAADEGLAAVAEAELPWDPPAWDAVAAAPGLIRARIVPLVEAFARERGFGQVTLETLQEARRAMRLD